MTDKIYKSAKGKTVDLGAIILKNESVLAVGNMGVNARGDRVDADGKVTEARSKTVSKDLTNQTIQRKSTDVPSSKRRALEEDDLTDAEE
jgi:deoxycytidylate deaminase